MSVKRFKFLLGKLQNSDYKLLKLPKKLLYKTPSLLKAVEKQKSYQKTIRIIEKSRSFHQLMQA